MEDLALLSFPGSNSQGTVPLPGANPGDVILSVVAVTPGNLGLDFSSSFMREIQFLGEIPAPTATGPLPYIVQTDVRNLSAVVFVALMRRKKFDRIA